MCPFSSYVKQSEEVRLFHLYPAGRKSGVSIHLMDYPGLTGDATFRREALECFFLTQVAVVVVKAGDIGRSAREAVREALKATGGDASRVC